MDTVLRSFRSLVSVPWLSMWLTVLLAMNAWAVEIEVINSPGNIVRKIQLCQGQLPADAAADYLLSHGIHDELYVPIESEYRFLVGRLCEEVAKSDSMGVNVKLVCQNANQHPTPFNDQSNTYVTLHFYDKDHLLEPGQEGPFHVRAYLRVGYDYVFHTQCICSKIVCSQEEAEAIAKYMFDNTAPQRL